MIEITFGHLNLWQEKNVADWVCEVKVDGKTVYYGELTKYRANESWKVLLKRVADDIKREEKLNEERARALREKKK